MFHSATNPQTHTVTYIHIKYSNTLNIDWTGMRGEDRN